MRHDSPSRAFILRTILGSTNSKLILIGALFVLQATALIGQLDKWPLTHYPMFVEPVKFPVILYKLRLNAASGESRDDRLFSRTGLSVFDQADHGKLPAEMIRAYLWKLGAEAAHRNGIDELRSVQLMKFEIGRDQNGKPYSISEPGMVLESVGPH